MSKLKVYGLYQFRHATHYDDCGSDRSVSLVAVDTSPDFLRTRWNLHQLAKRKRQERAVPPDFGIGETGIKWRGSTGGGCASVSYEAEIKIVPQMIEEW